VEPPSTFTLEFTSTGVGAKRGEDVRTFFVSQACGVDLKPLVKSGREKFGMKLVPWAAVAAELTPREEEEEDEEEEENGGDRKHAVAVADGRAFTFLPLPVKTGLPVHVNAYFELSSNRRDIWFGGDMSGGGAARSEWNGALLADAVAPAYASLIAAAATSLGPRAAYYSLFPTNTSLPQPWSLVLSPLFAALSGLPCVRAIDPTADARLLASSSSSSWVAPRAAFFPDPSVETPPDLAAALRAVGVRLIDGAPADVSAAFATHCPSVARRMSPAAARAVL
jgi:sacsin